MAQKMVTQKKQNYYQRLTNVAATPIVSGGAEALATHTRSTIKT